MSRPRRIARAQALADYMVLVGVLVAVILAVSYGAYSGFLQELIARIGSALDAVTGLLT
jgi:hypothetical protein